MKFYYKPSKPVEPKKTRLVCERVHLVDLNQGTVGEGMKEFFKYLLQKAGTESLTLQQFVEVGSDISWDVLEYGYAWDEQVGYVYRDIEVEEPNPNYEKEMERYLEELREYEEQNTP